MDLSQVILVLVSISIPILMYLFRRKTRNGINKEKIRTLPPGSTGLPFIGESLTYLWKTQRGFQSEFFKERMEKYSSKIFKTGLFSQPIAVLCNAEGNKFLFANEGKLVKLWMSSKLDTVIPVSGKEPVAEHSKRLRSIVLPYFLKGDALRKQAGIMDAVMKQHLEKYWIGKDKVNISEMTKKYTLTLGWNIFLGITDSEEAERVLKGMEEVESAIIGARINLPQFTLNPGIKAGEIMRSEIMEIIRQKKVDVSLNPDTEKDFISNMILGVEENGDFVNDEDIASYLLALLQAAYTSVHPTICMLMKSLAELPHVYQAVLKEQMDVASSKEPGSRLMWEDFRKMKYSWNVICETLRLYSPGAGFKEAITDFTYEGYTIPKGWKIHWAGPATHKDPKYFKNPEKFDPTRFEGDGPTPYTFVPFGGGPRMCPGNEYTRLVTLTFVHHVMINFRWEKLNPNEKISNFPIAMPAQGLPVRLYPRKT
ncbi:OLC1v1002872C1 [Oldenlandia corymbosa var. corymbosa]|uniref:OLC1v1002872C1 n=1 Tax=Oldenlandia corymbosa var. corymbosa TaxID=529605 RepID=A0AAV1D8Z0_OLDCO|nr:OLC1v1002872C1 [Oldenlandia corymbosa var. corymbosa]